MASIDIVIDNLSYNKGSHDSLGHHYLFSTFYPQAGWEDGAYETLKGKGLDLVSSVELRGKIVEVYEQERQKMLLYLTNSSNFANNSLYPTHIKHFRVTEFDVIANQEQAVPIDYFELVHSTEYMNTISFGD